MLICLDFLHLYTEMYVAPASKHPSSISHFGLNLTKAYARQFLLSVRCHQNRTLHELVTFFTHLCFMGKQCEAQIKYQKLQ